MKRRLLATTAALGIGAALWLPLTSFALGTALHTWNSLSPWVAPVSAYFYWRDYSGLPAVAKWLPICAAGAGILAALPAAIMLFRPSRHPLRAARQGETPPKPQRALSDTHGNADWLTIKAARELFPGPAPGYGGVVVGEAYRVDQDSVAAVRLNPDDPKTWGQGGKAPLLIDPCTSDATHGAVFAGSGGYKAQPLDAKVLTPTGFRQIGDLRVRDLVQSPGGHPVCIAGVHPQGVKEIWRVTFKDGRTVECCDDHLWKVWTRTWESSGECGVRGKRSVGWCVYSLSKIRDRLHNKRSAWKALAVPLVEPFAVEMPQQTLPIPPYALGTLLGDGNFSSGSTVMLSTADQPILDRMLYDLPDYRARNNPGTYDHALAMKVLRKHSPLRLSLESLNLWGCRSHEKFVPDMYKIGSAAQRLALLQGLLDTDGAVQGGRSTYAIFVTTSERLARDVQELAWSLGAIATIRPQQTNYTYLGIIKDGRPSWRVSIVHPDIASLFSVPRKVESCQPKIMRHRLNIVSIESVGMKPAICISLTSDDGLYVTDNYVVTHNTTAVAIPTLAYWTGSAVVLDPSCQVGPMTAPMRRDMGHKVVMIGPGLGGVNVLDWIDPRDPLAETYVQAVIERVAGETPPNQAGENSIFKVRGKELLTCLLADLLWDSKVPASQKTLRELRARVRTPEKKMKGLLADIQVGSESPLARDLAGTLVDVFHETFSGIYSNANADTQWLSIKVYADMLSDGSFGTGELAGGKLTVFIQVPMESLRATPEVARVIVGSLLGAAYRADGRLSGRVLFLLDEVNFLGKLKVLEDARDAGRKYGITLLCMWQSLGQLTDTWGKEGKGSWFNSCSWRLFAAVDDDGTAEEVSRTAGKYTVLARTQGQSSSTQSGGVAGSRNRGMNEGLSEQARELIKPDEVRTRMRADEAIIFRRGAAPLRCGRPIFFRRPELKARVEADRYRSAAE